MATTTRVLDANVNGTVYTSNANAALEALDTCHSGATAPTDEVANGKLWLDTSTTPGTLKIYNNATWEVVHSGPFTSDVSFGDNDKAIFGAGSDLQIYHDGSNSYVKDQGTGNLNLQGENIALENTSGVNYFVGINGGASSVYHSGALKLATTSTGVDVTGTVSATNFVGDGSALTGITSIPASTIIYVAKSTAPTGYLKANGAAISRTTYAALFAAIGTTFGSGNGSTTFNVPDLRGEFIRGWDDARGVDSGRSFGSTQGDAFGSHKHLNGSKRIFDAADGLYGSASYGAIQDPLGRYAGNANYNVDYTETVGGSETRPRNIALLACIKY